MKCHTCTVRSGETQLQQSVSLFLYSWRGCLSRVVEPLGIKFSFRKELLYFSSNVFMNDIHSFFTALYLYIWYLSFSVAVLPCVLCLTRVCLILSTVHKIAFQPIYVQFCMGTLDICAPAYTVCVNRFSIYSDPFLYLWYIVFMQ